MAMWLFWVAAILRDGVMASRFWWEENENGTRRWREQECKYERH